PVQAVHPCYHFATQLDGTRWNGLAWRRGCECVLGPKILTKWHATERAGMAAIGVGDLLEGGATLRRSPPGQHIALQPRVVPAGRLQRALGDGELDALALKARIELIDAPFGLGPIGSSIDLDFGDAVGQRLDLLFGVGKRGLT